MNIIRYIQIQSSLNNLFARTQTHTLAHAPCTRTYNNYKNCGISTCVSPTDMVSEFEIACMAHTRTLCTLRRTDISMQTGRFQLAYCLLTICICSVQLLTKNVYSTLYSTVRKSRATSQNHLGKKLRILMIFLRIVYCA